jgi:hypothetical protein
MFDFGEAGKTYIKVYSNCDNVELFLNGASLGMLASKGTGVFIMEDVLLEVGQADVKAVGTCADEPGSQYIDTITWKIIASRQTDQYENIVLHKPVYASSEEGIGSDGASTVAENIVDGDESSRWAAQTKNAAGEWDAKYPEWICVDLGAVYNIAKIDLVFESKANRTYDYKIYTSLDTVPEEKQGPVPAGFTEVYARIGNTEVGKQSAITLEETQARYVLIEMLSCSAYSEVAKYVTASIFELSVAGEKAEGTE